MAGADTSLLPVIVGGLLTLGGTVAAAIVSTIRDEVQKRRDARKRRADKFEELVAAVYEFDHWLSGVRSRDAFGQGEAPHTVTPFAKVQSISAVYFPQFDEAVRELDAAATSLRLPSMRRRRRDLAKTKPT
jgi:hypothetical protein